MDERRAEKLAALQDMIDAVPADAGLRADEMDPANVKGSREPSHRTPRKAGHGRSRRRDGETDAIHSRGGEDGRGISAVNGKRLPPAEAAFKRIVDLCSYHEFCTAKLRERLKRDAFPPAAIDEAIDKAVRIGLVDDIRWGEMRASALMRKGMGQVGIIRELKQLGISANAIGGWPHEYEERFGTESERALDILRKSPPRSKNPRSSAYSKLIRKGYDPSTASHATSMWLAEHENDFS